MGEYFNKCKQLFYKEKTIFCNISSLMILQVSKYIFPLVIMPYLIRTLGIANYGILIFSQTMATYFVMLTNYGFYLSAPREISIYRENIDKRNEIISSIFIIKSIFMVISIITMILFITFLEPFNKNSAVFLTSMILVVNEVVSPIWFFQGIEEMEKITIFNIIGRCISVVIMFIIVKEPNHIVRAAFVQSLGGLISGIISIIILFTRYDYKFVKIHFKELFKLLINGWDFFISQLSTVLFTNVNVTMLGLLANPEAVGIYSTGEKVVRLAVSIVNPISSAIFPNISKILVQSRKKGVYKLKGIMKIGIVLFVFISAMLYLGADLIVGLLIGELNIQIAMVIKILCLLPIFVFINNIYGTQYMINCGMKKQFRNIIVISGSSLIVFSYSLVSIIGIYGAAIASFASELLLVILMIYYIEFRNKKFSILRKVV